MFSLSDRKADINAGMQCFRSHRPPRSRTALLSLFLSGKGQRGVTLVELMTVITVLAVLASVAIPSFNTLIQRWQIMQAAEIFQSTLYMARSEAMKRGGNVIVEKLACTGHTGGSDWSCGWRVCHSTNKDCKDGAGTSQIQRHEVSAKLDITATGGSTQRVKFNRFGRPQGPRGFGIQFVPKDQSTSHPAARGVCMASGGRVRIIKELPCKD